MPKYRSHKEVWALKIKSIVRDGEGENRESDGSAIITPEEYAPFRVEGDYLHKHKPQVGGYYVVYKDGYKSYSPAEAFEEGNTYCGLSNELEKITNAQLANELSNKGFYVNKISRGNDTDDVDYLVVSVNPPKDVKPVDHNTN